MVQEATLRKALLKRFRFNGCELIGPKGVSKSKQKYLATSFVVNGEVVRILQHRAIFLMFYGYLPDLVDHKDRDIRNNHPNNLRDASKKVNSLNIESFKRSVKLPRGVDFATTEGKYTARCKIDGKKVHLGTFNSLEEARYAAITRRDEEST